MSQTQLVLIPCPGAGHIFAAVELANLLVGRDENLSVAILVMRLPYDHGDNSFAESVETTRVQFIDLPEEDTFSDTSSTNILFGSIERHKPNVARAVAELASQSASTPLRLVGFVLDMFCMSMIDVAESFGVPSYVFFTGNAAVLGLMFFLQDQSDHGKNMAEYKDSDEELDFPGFACPLPAKVLPSPLFHDEMADPFLDLARRFRKTRGIIVNTFLELEEDPLKFLCSEPDVPKVYPIGPIVNTRGVGDDTKKNQGTDEILKWLDKQPAASVVFLCFGSMGSFGEDQVREIALALEKSDHRFIWSLRQAPKEKVGIPRDYGEDLAEVLPEGFLERTAEIGRVIGWAPQVNILAHPSTGGFVTHCGWNSILESIWYGVPIAVWPLYSEQQFNAFMITKEMGLATEITINYRKEFFGGSKDFVQTDKIEQRIRELMSEGGSRRRKTRELFGISRNATKDRGSSYAAFGEFISDLRLEQSF